MTKAMHYVRVMSADSDSRFSEALDDAIETYRQCLEHSRRYESTF